MVLLLSMIFIVFSLPVFSHGSLWHKFLLWLHTAVDYWYAVAILLRLVRRLVRLMDRSVYLDAMGISRWRMGQGESKPFLVLHDEDFVPRLNKQPLLADVLTLLGLDLALCQFDTAPIKGCQVVWDMRTHKTRPRTAWVNSEPLPVLLTADVAHKRALWQQICAYLDKPQ